MKAPNIEDDELKPCPFCNLRLGHITSWAISFKPPRLYHEYNHGDGDCVLSHKSWAFGDDEHNANGLLRKMFIREWNTRMPDHASLQDENKRLREALQSLEDMSSHKCHCASSYDLKEAKQIAREALSGKD